MTQPLLARLAVAIFGLSRSGYAQETSLVGAWEGTLHAGNDLRLVMHLTAASDGGLLGTLDNLDQGAKDIPITAISYKESKIRIETKTIGGAFEGQLKGVTVQVGTPRCGVTPASSGRTVAARGIARRRERR